MKNLFLASAAIVATGCLTGTYWFSGFSHQGPAVTVVTTNEIDSNANSELLRQMEQDEREFLAISSEPKSDRKLKQIYDDSIKGKRFVPPTASQLKNFERLMFESITEQKSFKRLQQEWSSMGWQLIRWTANHETILAICENANERKGRGLFVFRPGSHSKLVLQAPHRFYDVGTGTISRKLFEEHDCWAVAWNTVHRRTVDLAHHRDHYFNAFTRALIRSATDVVLVQIHGFANEKQKGAAQSTHLIVSDTTRYPGRLVRKTALAMKQQWGAEMVGLYPLEVRSLGGTTNQQAAVAKDAGSLGFLHLEINAKTRKSLKTSASMRSAFYQTLPTRNLIRGN